MKSWRCDIKLKIICITTAEAIRSGKEDIKYEKKTVTLKDYIMAISIFLIALVVGIFIFYSGVQHSIAKNSQERISTNVSRQSEHLPDNI